MMRRREAHSRALWAASRELQKHVSCDNSEGLHKILHRWQGGQEGDRVKRASLEEDEYASSKRSVQVATSVGVAGSLRSLDSLASLLEDKNSRDEVREMATDII